MVGTSNYFKMLVISCNISVISFYFLWLANFNKTQLPFTYINQHFTAFLLHCLCLVSSFNTTQLATRHRSRLGLGWSGDASLEVLGHQTHLGPRGHGGHGLAAASYGGETSKLAMGYPNSSLVCLQWFIPFKRMITRVAYFRKPPLTIDNIIQISQLLTISLIHYLISLITLPLINCQPRIDTGCPLGLSIIEDTVESTGVTIHLRSTLVGP